jgi:putative peptidoglycan lipid II flippase
MLNSLIVMGGAVLSRATGLLRDIIITARFGTGAELDAYNAAFRVTDMLYMVVIGGALGSAFIPLFIQIWDRDGSERAWKLASAVVTWALALLALASVLLFVAAPSLAATLYPTFAPEALQLTTSLMRLFLLSPLLLGLGGLAMAALNARDRFTLPALAPSVYNLGIIGGAWLLAPQLGVWGLGLGVVVGALAYLLVQIPGLLGLGMRLRPTFGRGMAELATIAWQMAPRVAGQAASQINLLISSVLTGLLNLGAGRIAGLNIALQLMLLPYGIFSLSLSTVAFPRLARLHAEGKRDEMAQAIRSTLGTIMFLTLPATVTLMVLAVPLVRLLYQRGAFDAESVRFTVEPLLGYATALPAFAASEILIRAFYAMQQTRTPVLVGIFHVVLNLTLGSLVVWLGLGVGAIALSFSIANNVEALLLFALLGRQLPGLWRNQLLWRSVAASALASLGLVLLFSGAIWLSAPLLPFLTMAGDYQGGRDLLPLLGWLVMVGGLGGLAYLGAATLLGANEGRQMLQRLRRH